MLKNYFRTAYRNLLRNRSFTIINIAGLGLSIACAIIIFLDVQFEFSFDNFHQNKNQIARVVTDGKYKDGSESTSAGVPLPMEEALRTDMPQLKNVTTTYALFESFISVTNAEGEIKKFKQDEGMYYVEPSLFQVFNFPWLTGNPVTTMNEPYSVALSKSIAEKFFGDWKKAPGQSIKINNSETLVVKGVMEDPPANSSIPLQIAISLATFRASDPEDYKNLLDWGNLSSDINCFVQLPPNVSIGDIDKLFPAFCGKHYKEETTMKKMNRLQALSDVHFNTNYETSVRTVRMSTLNGMMLIAVFILLMACINFINLATAMATRRSKEVGVRKVLGSSRAHLVKQFMGETFLLTIAATALGLFIASLALPFLKDLTNLPENISALNDPSLWIIALVLIVLVTLLAGSYPSVILSGFKPALAIKSKITSKTKSGVSLRTTLVVFQFVISQVLIIGTLITIRQLDYIRSADIGINSNTVMQIPMYNDSTALLRYSEFKQEVLELPGVISFSYSSDAPSSGNNWSTNFSFDHQAKDEGYHVYLKLGDTDFFRTYDVQFLAGRPFHESDTMKEAVINETLLKKLGLKNPQEAVGKDIRLGGGAWKPIVGVVKDFKTNSLREDVKPLYISERKSYYGMAGIRIAPKNISATVANVQKIWDKTFPQYYFENSFLDDNIAQFYIEDEKLSKLYKVVAAIGIIISCLGLFGLVSFLVANRTKEVGIRKVLGASVTHISGLFLKYFVVLVIIALVIAIPVGWYMMNNWLHNFVFRIRIGWVTFAVVAALSISIAILTVIIQILKVAFINPIKTLRSE